MNRALLRLSSGLLLAAAALPACKDASPSSADAGGPDAGAGAVDAGTGDDGMAGHAEPFISLGCPDPDDLSRACAPEGEECSYTTADQDCPRALVATDVVFSVQIFECADGVWQRTATEQRPCDAEAADVDASTTD